MSCTCSLQHFYTCCLDTCVTYIGYLGDTQIYVEIDYMYGKIMHTGSHTIVMMQSHTGIDSPKGSPLPPLRQPSPWPAPSPAALSLYDPEEQNDTMMH